MTLTLPSTIVSPQWLAEHRDDVVVLCASCGDPSRATVGIAGAYLADLDGEFSDQSDPRPHTIPDPETLRQLFAARGISDDTPVVVYDRHGVMFAPRVWWLARAAGLTDVAILDGGLPAWVQAGYSTGPLATIDSVSRGTITADPCREGVMDMAGVTQALADDTVAVVDARSAGRFTGRDPEPREGYLSGHMPGSTNLPFTDLFPDGVYVGDEKAREALEQATGGRQSMVFSCGSGVTACVDALVATTLGLGEVAVYEGSWSEWANPADPQPIETQ